MIHQLRAHIEPGALGITGVVVGTATSGTALQWLGLLLGFFMFGLGCVKEYRLFSRPDQRD